MMKPICEFSFNLCGWQVVCNKTLTAEDWQQGESYWHKNVGAWQDFAPKLAFLPPLKRRRLSESARLFFEAAWELTADTPDLPVVYASQNSEISRSFALWESLLQEGDVSPTSFSLSVHNALIGQWSELRQVKSEMTAITAQQDNLETALLEAQLLLNDGHSRVLVVVAESPLAEQYNADPIYRQPFAYALAMVVEKGEQYHVSLLPQAVSSEQYFAKDNALYWVQQHHLTQSHWQTASSRNGIWQWQKN